MPIDVPEDAPDVCPVCETRYDSVSRHDAGLMVNLLDNDRYRRVCFEPASHAGIAHVSFYHHTHEQVGSHERTANDAEDVVSGTRGGSSSSPDS
jgi:hypothetical protein